MPTRRFSPGKFFSVYVISLGCCLGMQAATILENFSGLSLSDVASLEPTTAPPDVTGAAGVNQFAEFVNGAFAIYNKTGGRQSLISDSNFWINAGLSATNLAAGLIHPRVAYDAGSGCWFASEITLDNTGNFILLARSDSSDAGGTWKAVSFLGSTSYADFDTLGVDSQSVYIGVNNYSDSSLNSFNNESFFSIPKADLLAGTPVISNMTRFDGISDQTYGFTLQGVCNADAGPGFGTILAVDEQRYNYIDLTPITNGTLGTPVNIFTSYDGNPNPATQPDGSMVNINFGNVNYGNDNRFASAARQVGNYLYLARTISEGGNDEVHWLVLNETNNAVAGEGVISDPSYDFFEPSIAASHSGNILVTFNRCGTVAPAGDISIYAVTGAISNGVVNLGSPFVLKQGNVNNFSNSFEWGSYSATVADPADDNIFWAIQEIPVSSTNWGTQIIQISFATMRPSLTITAAGSTVTVSWPATTDPAYVLQSNTNLANSASWTTLTNIPVVNGSQNNLTIATTNKSTYFRLKK